MNGVISVILPSYNNLSSLKRCIASLENQSWADFEVIVVIDGSTDGSLEWVQAHPWGKLNTVHLPQNQGRSVARNEGLQHAKGEWVLFLDSDAQAHPDLLKAHVMSHRGMSGARMVQGKIITGFTPEADFTPHLWTDSSGAFFDTGNVSAPREALIQAKGFDLAYTAYGWEDVDLGLRLRHQGVKPTQAPQALSYEQEDIPENWNALIQKEKERAQMAWVLYQKHPTPEVKWFTQIHTLSAWGGQLSYLLTGSKAQLKKRIQYLKDHHQPHLALALLRSWLNRVYLKALKAQKITHKEY